MPRLFMAMRQEDRLPIVDILAQTPDPPRGCQWALFLRNHDELTLEMVTEEERQYMYYVFATDPQARLNLGIRRRIEEFRPALRRAAQALPDRQDEVLRVFHQLVERPISAQRIRCHGNLHLGQVRFS